VIFTAESDDSDEFTRSKIIDFYESGAYIQEAGKLLAQIKTQILALPRSADDIIILDVDETALHSYEFIKGMDFGFFPERWNEWMHEGNIPANEPVLEFYNSMRQQDYTFLFLTGRLTHYGENTKKNLIRAGYNNGEELILRETYQDGMDAWEFKSGVRKQLTRQGYRILGNIGDQMSDVTGGYSAYHVRLPNLLYIV